MSGDFFQLNVLSQIIFNGRFIFGCSDPAFPPYPGNPNMQFVHRSMPISTALCIVTNLFLRAEESHFDFTAKAFYTTMLDLGFTEADAKEGLRLINTLK